MLQIYGGKSLESLFLVPMRALHDLTGLLQAVGHCSLAPRQHCKRHQPPDRRDCKKRVLKAMKVTEKELEDPC